ncbi:hypothetical protein Smp_191280 [Schistosoma mansoni]|uniref:hypothetical protein n=1 Tax=Schistosoma mansoni TaxID=6183 RepID=UPI00022DCA18|nr:hypothetical protein Smp_191280 [Schistosoma mansoni]|eukprot:XP_018654895.1 hypothetical protein Smp_191280 [Schistosoma mansoni]
MCELEKKEIRYTIVSYNLRYQEIGRSKMKSSTQSQVNDVLLIRYNIFVMFLGLKYKILVLKRILRLTEV